VNYLNANASEIELQVYPNPFQTQATFEIKNQDFKEGELHLFDLTGKLIRKEHIIEPRFPFKRGNLHTGIYAFLIILDGTSAISGKVVVQ